MQTVINTPNNALSHTQSARVQQSIKDLQYPFYLAFVGEWNKGKSSIINSIIGCDIAEVDDIPATTTPSLYIHEKTDIESDNDNHIKVCKVNIPRLHGLGIVDLPGLNSDISHGHDTIVRQFLPRCDQIILVTDIHQVWSESERSTVQYITDIGRNKDMISVINKADSAKDSNVLQKLSQYRLEMIADSSHSLFVISAHSPLKFEWTQFIAFLHSVHAHWEWRDTKKCDTALHILANIIDTELLPSNQCSLDILSTDKTVVLGCMSAIESHTKHLIENAEFQQSIRDVVYGRFSKIADDMKEFLSHKLSFLAKLRKLNFEKEGLHTMILNEIERLLSKYTNMTELNKSVNPWLYNLKTKMEQCIDDIILRLKTQQSQSNEGRESIVNDLHKIRSEILKQSIEDLSVIKIAFDYNSVDIMVQNIINKYQSHVALTQISALLLSPAFYLFNHPLLSVLTLSASAVWLTYKLNTFGNAIDQDLREFGNDLGKETFEAMIATINQTLQHTNVEVINALSPIIEWNNNEWKVINEQCDMIEKWKQAMTELRQEIQAQST